jgi:hypothetical protein
MKLASYIEAAAAINGKFTDQRVIRVMPPTRF